LERALRGWLEGLGPGELTECLIGGILFEELPFPSHSLTALMSEPGAFAIPPLPNHMFTRDASAWAYGGVSIHAMAVPARARESLHMALIYRHHPLFADTGYRMWTDAAGGPLGIEGGDVLVIGNGAVLVATGERTSPAAVEHYAEALFEAGAARRVIVTALPGRRATIHLDTVMTMVDRDAFAVYQGLPGTLDAYVLSPARGGLAVTQAPDLFEVVREALELPHLRLIRGDWDDGTAQREQWSEGSNLLAIRPGVVIAYDRNADTNARLRDNGIEVIAVPGSELSRGRGGPRCLTCPIERAPIP
jgi:arginine deiminase